MFSFRNDQVIYPENKSVVRKQGWLSVGMGNLVMVLWGPMCCENIALRGVCTA